MLYEQVTITAAWVHTAEEKYVTAIESAALETSPYRRRALAISLRTSHRRIPTKVHRTRGAVFDSAQTGNYFDGVGLTCIREVVADMAPTCTSDDRPTELSFDSRIPTNEHVFQTIGELLDCDRWPEPPACIADHAPVNYVAAPERVLS